MTDKNGNVVAKYEYDAWGTVLKSETSLIASGNPFGYAGYMYDKETGLYYLMARYYHPTHGVFISVDPDPGDEDDPITQNGYTYVNNNPNMFVDMDGFRGAKPSYIHDGGRGRGAGFLKEPMPKNSPRSKSKNKNKNKSKPINLPSYKTIIIDMKHIIEGHTKSGGRATQSGIKDLFPSNMSPKQIQNAIRNAYRYGKKIQSQGDRVKIQGRSGSLTIEMWVNIKTKVIETAYPIY